MDNNMLTPWFDGALVKPKRLGVYMLMSGLNVGYQQWDGVKWGPWCINADKAASYRPGNYAAAQFQNDNWRGLRAGSNA